MFSTHKSSAKISTETVSKTQRDVIDLVGQHGQESTTVSYDTRIRHGDLRSSDQVAKFRCLYSNPPGRRVKDVLVNI